MGPQVYMRLLVLETCCLSAKISSKPRVNGFCGTYNTAMQFNLDWYMNYCDLFYPVRLWKLKRSSDHITCKIGDARKRMVSHKECILYLDNRKVLYSSILQASEKNHNHERNHNKETLSDLLPIYSSCLSTQGAKLTVALPIIWELEWWYWPLHIVDNTT